MEMRNHVGVSHPRTRWSVVIPELAADGTAPPSARKVRPEVWPLRHRNRHHCRRATDTTGWSAARFSEALMPWAPDPATRPRQYDAGRWCGNTVQHEIAVIVGRELAGEASLARLQT